MKKWWLEDHLFLPRLSPRLRDLAVRRPGDKISGRKGWTVWQILCDFGAPPTQNSASMHRMRCATRPTSVQLAAESALHLLPELRDVGVRKRAKFREKTRERVANFV